MHDYADSCHFPVTSNWKIQPRTPEEGGGREVDVLIRFLHFGKS